LLLLLLLLLLLFLLLLLRQSASCLVSSSPTSALFAGRRAVLFGVPGAFTPVCSKEHLLQRLDAAPL